MSLYNMLFNENQETAVLLGMLGVNKDFFARFRDVDLIKDGTIIRVFTRLGGGNREYYEDEWDEIRCHSLYIKDYDDDYDETYAYIEFNIPEEYKETAKKMFKGEPLSFQEKFEKQLEDLKNPNSQASKVAEQIVDKINDAMESGNNIIGI